jgi:DNA-binding beta-propeller fold protein YncE
LIANNRRLSMKLLISALLIITTSGMALSTGFNTMLNNNQVVQAQQQQEEEEQEQTNINKVWETTDTLKNPESVVYAAKQDILFVSNIDGKPDEKDQKGFISKVSPNGNITELNWITGLDAPKGMDIYNNSKLYVSDISDLVEIDIANGKIIKRYNAPGSTFLNDVASDNQGNIYVSDTATNTIYKLNTNLKNNTSLQVWLQSPELNSPSGLYVDNNNNKLIVAFVVLDLSKPGASMKVVDLENKTISSLGNEGTTTPLGGLDGIESDATGTHYYVTDHPVGKVYTVNADGTGYRTLIDLQREGTADLEFISGQNMIIIPLLQDNKIAAYKLVE